MGDIEVLHFCTRCGDRVPPYRPSGVALHDMYEYGQVPEGLAHEPHYWCPRCQKRWLATNQMDTGRGCSACRAFMPLAATHCGVCGTKM